MKPHQILELPLKATAAEIKAAFRRLSMVHHPDRPGGDIGKFQRLVGAYEALQTKTCSQCDGSGQITTRNGAFSKKTPCPSCWRLANDDAR